jgi:hypothetical protein
MPGVAAVQRIAKHTLDGVAGVTLGKLSAGSMAAQPLVLPGPVRRGFHLSGPHFLGQDKPVDRAPFRL